MRVTPFDFAPNPNLYEPIYRYDIYIIYIYIIWVDNKEFLPLK